MEKRDVIPGFRLAMFLVITGVLSGMLVAGVLIALFIKDFNSDYTNRLSLFVGEIFIPLPVIVWALVKKVDTGKLFRFNLRNIRPRHIFYTVVLGAGISILTDEVDRLIQKIFSYPLKFSYLEEFMKIQDLFTAVYIVVLILIIAPLIEEMVFRGFLLRVFEYRIGDVTKAILLNALIFAIFHFNPWWFVQIFILGIFMGYLAWKTDSILLSFTLHFCVNGLSVFFINAGEKVREIYEVSGHVSPVFIVLGIVFFYIGMRYVNNRIQYVERVYPAETEKEDMGEKN